MRTVAAWIVCLLLSLSAAASTHHPDEPALTISTQSPAAAFIAGAAFHLPMAAEGGTQPYTWSVVSGHLPPGLRLHPHNGKLSGVPTTEGEYPVVIGVTDSGYPQQHAQREIVIRIVAAVTIDWKQQPQVQGNTLSGSVVVSNQTAHNFNLTVVIVAVNSHGRATALGYQHFTLAPQTTGQVIPFTGTPGMGTYIVHVDAVAHSHHHTYRSRKQTADSLTISQL